MAKMLKPIDTPDAEDNLSVKLLGQFVRAKRTQLGLRIEEAAAFSGVAKDTLMKLEHGREKVQLGTAFKICKALGIKLKVLSWENENENDTWV